MNAVAFQSAPESKWTVVNGPMKGVVRLMSQPQFSIGRSTECEFVIVNDPKCSRKHAVITATPQGCEVHSQNDKNLVQVNGKEIERAILKDGDIVMLGETEIQFNSTSRRADAPPMAVVRPPAGPFPMPGQTGAPARRGRALQVKKSPAPRLIIYGVLGLLAIIIFTPTKSKKKTIDLRMEQQIQADIETATKLKDVADASAMKRLDQSVTARQAQENYIRGFRDYKKGQYERSLVSFQACLALNPEHILCNRYIRLAQRKFDEIIQLQVVLGRKYRDQNQFKACRASFRNVMVMMKDSNSAIFKEAKANYEACNAFVEDRF